MSESPISESEAQDLIDLPKLPCRDTIVAPRLRSGKMFEFESVATHDEFTIDVYRGPAFVLKATHHMRTRRTIGLVRVEVNTAGHENPDGTKVGPHHIHRYREGFGLAWAKSLSTVQGPYFKDPSDIQAVFHEFLQFCNVVDLPVIQDSLSL